MRSQRWILAAMAVGMLVAKPCHAQSSSLVDRLASGLESMFQDAQSAQTASTALGYAGTASNLSTVWHMTSDVTSAFSQVDASTNNPDAQDSVTQANQAFDNFHDEFQNQALGLIVPGGAATVEKAEKIANEVESTVNSVEDTASSIANRVNSYLSGSSDYGLEPGSSDAQTAQQAIDASGQPLTADASDITDYDSVDTTDQGSGGSDEMAATGQDQPVNGHLAAQGQDQPANDAAGSTADIPDTQSEEASNLANSLPTTAATPVSPSPDSASNLPAEPQEDGTGANSSAAGSSASNSANSDLLDELQQGGVGGSPSGGDSSALPSGPSNLLKELQQGGITTGSSGTSGGGSGGMSIQQLRASIAQWNQEQAAKAKAERVAEQRAAKAKAERAAEQKAAEAQADQQQAVSQTESEGSDSGGDCQSVLQANMQNNCQIPNDGSICDTARATESCYENAANAGADVCPASAISQYRQEAQAAAQTANSVCDGGSPSVSPYNKMEQYHQLGQVLGRLLGKALSH